MWLHRLVQLCLLAGLSTVFVVSQGCAQRLLVEYPDDTPTRADGRVASTAGSPKTFASPDARAKAVAHANEQRATLLGQLKPPMATARRLTRGMITIDGKLDESAWQTAQVVTDFKNSKAVTPESETTRVRMAWDARYLYVAFECQDSDIVATITERDGELWREDCVEVFIDANGDGMSYVEYEVSPLGVFYDAALADYRPSIDWVKDLAHLDLQHSLECYTVRDSPMAVAVNGTLNDSSDTDSGYVVELAISWADLARGTNASRLPPRDGDLMGVGLYRINIRTKADPKTADYAAWSPTKSWFHVPFLFGRVLFID